MTGKQKRSAFFLTLLFTLLWTVFFLFSAFLIYYNVGIDGTLDIDALAGGQNLTTKIYAVSETGEPVEIESERLYGSENRIWIPLSEVPDSVKNAFIAIEDHRFYSHKGVDFYRTAGAVLSFFGGRSYGGSTITQQLIKNLTGESSVTVRRKLTEIKRAITLEKSISKDRILELYLNTVYLSEGCYGIRTAAEKYFSKDVSDLTLCEGATLAGILRYPAYFDPIRHPENSRVRRNVVLRRMNEVHYIDEEEYEKAVAEPLRLEVSQLKKEGSTHSWFTDAVIEDVITDLEETRGLSRTAASALLYGGGLTVYTTMRPGLQAELERLYADESLFPKNKAGESAESSCILIDSQTGDVVALVGGRGEKTSDRLFNMATQMPRSPGSVIKPVSVYAPALEEGLITWSSVFDDIPYSFYKTENGYGAWPKNNPRLYSGLTTVKTAVENSVNTVSVRVLERLGIARSYSFCRKAGLTTLVDRKKKENGEAVTDMALAPLALGALTDGVTLRDMTAAYTMFANGGEGSRARTYTLVLDKNGKPLLEKKQNTRTLIKKETAELMTKLLRNVVLTGTGNDVALGKTVPIAGKTGTSSANTDRWFIGYTENGLVGGVWYGFKEAKDIGVYTGNPAAVVYNGVMTSLYEKELISLPEAVASSGKESALVPVLYCKDSGKLPGRACSLDPRGHRIELGYFISGTEPTEECDAHTIVRYDSVTGGIACEDCPAENVKEVGLVKTPERSFPCSVTISDAQYMFTPLPEDVLPSVKEGSAYFDSLCREGEFFGTSGKKHPFNSLCREHWLSPEEKAEREKIKERLERTASQTDIGKAGEEKGAFSSPRSRKERWKNWLGKKEKNKE